MYKLTDKIKYTMNRLKFVFILLLFFIVNVNAKNSIARKELIELIDKVNNYWQSKHPDPGNAFWDNAVYHTGNMEAYKLTKNESYRTYSEKWAIQNQWQGAKGTDRSQWKSTYGETPDYVLFGDWQICFQTYIDLYNLSPDSLKIKRVKEVMEYQMTTSRTDYWWWVDGLYMVMPVMTKMYKLTGDRLYLDKLYAYYAYADKLMSDTETNLFYRDKRYIYPEHKSVNSKKDFWARGNGWIFAALAKIIPDLPEDYQYREVFVSRFKKMAASLAILQQKEGCWTRSIVDPEHAPGPETSGTALFTYGFLWGVNNGYLKEAKFKQVALSGWNFLQKQAVQVDGKIGFVQPIGEKAIPGQIVNENSTANFGVGAFLLAASEMVRYVERSK